jgi:hypothetical protein
MRINEGMKNRLFELEYRKRAWRKTHVHLDQESADAPVQKLRNFRLSFGPGCEVLFNAPVMEIGTWPTRKGLVTGFVEFGNPVTMLFATAPQIIAK